MMTPTIYADEIITLKFGDIEQCVLNGNSDIKANNDSLTSSASLQSTLKKLTDTQSQISISLSSINTKINSIADHTSELYYLYGNLYILYSNLYGNLQLQIDSINTQISNQLKSSLQIQAANYEIVWTTQQLLLSYNSLKNQKEDLGNKLPLIQKKLRIAQRQKDLEMITNVQIKEVTNELNNLNNQISTINKNMEVIKQQINILIGKEYDSALNIEEPEVLDKSLVNSINYNNDLNIGLSQSFNIRIEDNSNKINSETRKFKAAFNQAYQAIQDKVLDIQTENSKLEFELEKLNSYTLKYSFGVISKIELDNEIYSLNSQKLKVKTSEQELVKVYTAYKWMLRGLNTTVQN